MKKKEIKHFKLYTWIKQKDSGATNIELIVAFFVILFMLSLIINVLPIFVKKHTLDYIANEAVRIAEVTGGTNTPEVSERLTELLDASDIEIEEVSWEGTEYMEAPNNERVQINGKIQITLKSSYQLAGNKLENINALDVKFPMSSTSTGRSEVYFKK